MSAISVDATFYAQVRPTFSSWQKTPTGDSAVESATVERITQKRPVRPVPGTVLVKLTIRLPKVAFYPMRPEAVVVVPESMTEATPVVVEALDPSGEAHA